jgi:hypothetical protein
LISGNDPELEDFVAERDAENSENRELPETLQVKIL